MNILWLEDKGHVTYHFEKLLTLKGHDVNIAKNISDAKSLFRRNNFNCIIADLNISPTGLSEGETAMTVNGLISGWIWLKCYVYEIKPEMRKRTIIYSAYLKEFRENVPDDEYHAVIKIAKIRIGPSSKEHPLLNAIEEIAGIK